MTFRVRILALSGALILLLSLVATARGLQHASPHFLYTIVPQHRSHIAWYDVGRWTTWALLGNDDDGIFGEHASRPLAQELSVMTALQWTLRNPLHNFCFYVIGSADRVNNAWKLLQITPELTITFDYQPVADTVFAGKHSSLLLAFHGGKPFLSICWEWSQDHQTKIYLGWRCRGNFGIKCVL